MKRNLTVLSVKSCRPPNKPRISPAFTICGKTHIQTYTHTNIRTFNFRDETKLTSCPYTVGQRDLSQRQMNRKRERKEHEGKQKEKERREGGERGR